MFILYVLLAYYIGMLLDPYTTSLTLINFIDEMKQKEAPSL